MEREKSPGGSLYRDEEKLIHYLSKEEAKELQELIKTRHKLKIALQHNSRFSETIDEFFSHLTPSRASDEHTARMNELLKPNPELQALFLQAYKDAGEEKESKKSGSKSAPTDEELSDLLEFCLKEIKQEIFELKKN